MANLARNCRLLGRRWYWGDPVSELFGFGLETCGSDVGLRHVMSGSALPTILQSASRRADFSGLPGSLLLRPVKLLAPCADLTGVHPATGTFVGSEEAHESTLALASVRLSNCTCSFPACSSSKDSATPGCKRRN